MTTRLRPSLADGLRPGLAVEGLWSPLDSGLNAADWEILIDPSAGATFGDSSGNAPAWAASFSNEQGNPAHSAQGWAFTNDRKGSVGAPGSALDGKTLVVAATHTGGSVNDGLFGCRPGTGSATQGFDWRCTAAGNRYLTIGDGASSVGLSGAPTNVDSEFFTVGVYFDDAGAGQAIPYHQASPLTTMDISGLGTVFHPTENLDIGGAANSLPFTGTIHGFGMFDGRDDDLVSSFHDYFEGIAAA